MIFMSEAEVLQRLSLELAYEAVEQALVAASDGSGTVYPVLIGGGFRAGEVFAVKAGNSPAEQIIGLKIGSYWPGNAARGIARHGSAVVLLDPDTGRMRAVVEASCMNGPRTAAADAVAAARLANPAAETLTVIGAGHQARFEVFAICAVRPIRRVLIVSRDQRSATSLQGHLSLLQGIEVVCTDMERGCREADILVTVTSAHEPLFAANWIRPGTHVSSMGSDQPGKQELPVDLLRHGKLFCDSPRQSVSMGEFQHVKTQIEDGSIKITAIGDVVRGAAPGRESASEITIFDSSGIALQDLYVAARLIRDRSGEQG